MVYLPSVLLLTATLLGRSQSFTLQHFEVRQGRTRTSLLAMREVERASSSLDPLSTTSTSLSQSLSLPCTRRHCVSKWIRSAFHAGVASSSMVVLSTMTEAHAQVQAQTYMEQLPSRSNELINNKNNDKEFLKQQEMKLWTKVHQRKPSSNYTPQEKQEIDAIISEITSFAKSSESVWQRDLLPGIWRVAYLQQGENGGGLDRRIPFPELPFNDSYQRFTINPSSVTNIGELLGPSVRVEVSGSLTEDDAGVDTTPKRFRADIARGDLCAGNLCVKLPIEGMGLFDGVYLGEKIRIGQNLNGSGALVVQVRVDTIQ